MSLQVEQLIEKAKAHPVATAIAGLTSVLGGFWIFRKRQVVLENRAKWNAMMLGNNSDATITGQQYGDSIKDYETFFKNARTHVGANSTDEQIELRKKSYEQIVNHFYNLVTDFYEYGWCDSFHFGPRWRDEAFWESVKRAEYHLCSRLGMKPGMKALDVGCGVGGPMRNMAKFSGCTIEGITINAMQVKRGNAYNEEWGFSKAHFDRGESPYYCRLIQGDFQAIHKVEEWKATGNGPMDKYFDVAYEIEATCHSPDRVNTFSGINSVLKMGGKFAGYEWVMLKGYDKDNTDHIRIKEGIEVGNALPTLVGPEVVIKAMEDSGFEVLDHYDANRGIHEFQSKQELPWYETLAGKMSLSGFRMTHVGRMCTHTMVWILEFLTIAPVGSTMVSALLNATAIDLVDGGRACIFTPSYFFIGEKVREAQSASEGKKPALPPSSK